jgi:hypothetical protein
MGELGRDWLIALHPSVAVRAYCQQRALGVLENLAKEPRLSVPLLELMPDVRDETLSFVDVQFIAFIRIPATTVSQ